MFRLRTTLPQIPADVAVIDAKSLGDWKQLHGGGFDIVYKARHHRWGRNVSITIYPGFSDDGDDDHVSHVAEMTRRAENPYSMKLLGIFKGCIPGCQSVQLGIVMELMEIGSLASLQETLNHLPPWPLVFRLVHQVALGMKYLHSLTPALIHKDLKPQNILLDLGLNVKITDFGLAKFFNTRTSIHLEGACTPFYVPPEVHKGLACCADDVYSYAELVWSILNTGQTYNNLNFKTVKGERPPLEYINGMQAPGLELLVELMKRCWSQKMEDRPTFAECTAVTERLYEMHKPGIHRAVYEVQTELDNAVILKNPKRECTAVTERLYETHKLGIDDAVRQVQQEQDGAVIRKDTTRAFHRLTLDTNTAHQYLSLSENNRKVTGSRKGQSPPDHRDRFDEEEQVLCTESLTGRCYWEVEWSGVVEIAVTYRGIRRKGDGEDCLLGWNDKSWSLFCSGSRYNVRHNGNLTELPVRPSSPYVGRVAVDLDCPAGTLSFYTVSPDTLTHLHTFKSTFTEALYAAFYVSPDLSSSVSLCEQQR